MKYLLILAAITIAGCADKEVDENHIEPSQQKSEQVVTAKAPDNVIPASGTQAGALKGVRYVGVTVSDIDDTLAFYNQGVTYDVVDRYRLPASDLPRVLHDSAADEIDVAIVRLPNVFLRLIDFDPKNTAEPEIRPVAGPGYTHICFISAETNSAYTKFQAAGMQMISRGDEPVDLGGYGMRYAYGVDPDGTMIEMEVATKPRRPDDFWVGHIANVTPDINRMAAFYADVLGFEPRRTAELSNNPRADDITDIDNVAIQAAWFSTANLDLEFWQYTNPVTPEHAGPQMLDRIGYNSIAFEVTDLTAQLDRLKGKGIEPVGSSSDINGWDIAWFRDPDGNIFSLQQNVSAGEILSMDNMVWMTAGDGQDYNPSE